MDAENELGQLRVEIHQLAEVRKREGAIMTQAMFGRADTLDQASGLDPESPSLAQQDSANL